MSITMLDEAQEAGNASIHFEWQSRYQVHFTQKWSCKIQQSHRWSGRPNSKGEEGQLVLRGLSVSPSTNSLSPVFSHLEATTRSYILARAFILLCFSKGWSLISAQNS